jgi:hypothetical protein
MFIVAAVLIAAAGAGTYKVDPGVGNNNFSAVFEAPLGERINAVSSQVGCELTLDAASTTAAGSCSVPLTSIMIDNEPIKADHFQQWATNKKVKPKQCAFTAKFDGVTLEAPPEEGKMIKFAGEVPFTICGRARADGKPEHLEGTAQLLPAGTGGSARGMKIRAHVDKFNRDAYRIGPKYTEGWLARVQQLAPVVAEDGSIDFTLFAKSAAPAKAEESKPGKRADAAK